MDDTALSVEGVLIRLSDERWQHIVSRHPEMVDHRADVLTAIEKPQRVLAGAAGEKLALREILPGKMVVTVYQETADGGFVVTAFLTKRLRSLNRRKQLWPQ